jgi:hypothetical protein
MVPMDRDSQTTLVAWEERSFVEMLLRAGILIGFLVNHNSPLFFASVASKGLTISLSPLFATHTRVPGSVASKELALHQNCAEKAASVFGDAANSTRGRPIGVAGVQFMQKCSMLPANCQ